MTTHHLEILDFYIICSMITSREAFDLWIWGNRASLAVSENDAYGFFLHGMHFTKRWCRLDFITYATEYVRSVLSEADIKGRDK